MKTIRICTIILICLMVQACTTQNTGTVEGEWFLHEIQIPSNEEYDDEAAYGQINHMVLKHPIPALSETDLDDLDRDFEASYERALAAIEKDKKNAVSDCKATDTASMEDMLREIKTKIGIDYDIMQDSILVLSVPVDYPEAEAGLRIYVIKELTQDRLLLETGGRLRYVYGRTERPIKRTKRDGR